MKRQFKLAISLVIILLFLGLAYFYLFSTPSNPAGCGGTCFISAQGYAAQDPVLNSSGMLTFEFVQSSNSTLNNVELACTAQNSPSQNEFMIVNASLASGELANASVQCYDKYGNPFSSSIGTVFYGSIWMNHTNATSVTKVVSFALKVAVR